MTLKLLYFAHLREALGTGGEDLAVPAHVTDVRTLRAHLAARGGTWKILEESQNLRTAVNQQMAGQDSLIAAGDEVAFFPPVTGG
ncbi:MAG: molybdopterin converting factor subunit 1 [Betaproteobacteria bacterium]|nr:molybdopterin converting factor subunit 1 [Betaproteobacteria bacterium]